MTNQLPPLPEPDCKQGEDMPSPEGGFWADLYTADQMHAYASAALAQQSAQPVAWLTPGQDLHLNNAEGFSDWTPLYAAPQQAAPAQSKHGTAS